MVRALGGRSNFFLIKTKKMEKKEIKTLLLEFIKFYHGVPVSDWSMEQIEEFLENYK